MYCLKIELAADYRPWVARITGLHPEYGFERKFVPAMKDYTDATRSGRGVVCCFFLEPGEVYEVYDRRSYRSKDRYYCRVTSKMELERIQLEEVMAAIRVNEEIAKATRPRKLSEKIYGGS